MTNPAADDPYGYPGPGQPQPYGYGPSAYPPGAPPGYPVGPGYRQLAPPPENHLVWGILTTILCCLPFGVVSIVKANQVNTLWAQGQFQAAQQASEDAKKFAIISAACAVALFVVPFVILIIIGAVGAGLFSGLR